MAEWKSYRRHTAKNTMWILPQLVAQGARKLDHLKSIVDQSSSHPRYLDDLKQTATYTDAQGPSLAWLSPTASVDEMLAKSVVGIASILVPSVDGPMTSGPELEIWVKHMRPVWKRSMSNMKRALVAAYSEAHELGVLRGRATPKGMMSFVSPFN